MDDKEMKALIGATQSAMDHAFNLFYFLTETLARDRKKP